MSLVICTLLVYELTIYCVVQQTYAISVLDDPHVEMFVVSKYVHIIPLHFKYSNYTRMRVAYPTCERVVEHKS